jgi:hypothetical protein
MTTKDTTEQLAREFAVGIEAMQDGKRYWVGSGYSHGDEPASAEQIEAFRERERPALMAELRRQIEAA